MDMKPVVSTMECSRQCRNWSAPSMQLKRENVVLPPLQSFHTMIWQKSKATNDDLHDSIHFPELYIPTADSKLRRTARNGTVSEVPFLPSDDFGRGLRWAGDGARRRRVREGPRGPHGAHARAVRDGHAESPCQGPGELLRPGAKHRPQPQVPLRRHAVEHRTERRRQAGGGDDDSQALQHREPPHRVQMWTIYPAMRSTRIDGVGTLTTVQ